MSGFLLFNNVPFPTPIEVINQDDTNLQVESRENTTVNVISPYSTSAFGENIVTQLSPVIQLQFPYGVSTSNTIQFFNGTGALTSSNSQLVLSTGSTILSDAAIASRDFLTYQPGVGALARFTAGFDTGSNSVSTFQQIGLGTQEDGFFFSYTNNDINILIRKGGLRTQYSLKITGPATSGGDITLTLNGSVQTIPVTLSDVNTNATEIGTFDFPFYNNSANGNTVNIIAERTGPQTGTFSFSAGTTGMTATLTLEVTGVTETTDTINRKKWNNDVCDGSDFMPAIDWSKGNVYQIRYQWLGYGVVSFYIENPNNGYISLVHQYKYPNMNITPSIYNPSMQFLANVANALTTKNVSMFICSVGCFVEGSYPSTSNLFGNNVSNFYTNTVGNTTKENVVTFRSPPHFQGVSTRAVVYILRLIVTVSTAANIEISRNSVLTGDTTWTSLGANVLLESSDDAADVSGGEIIYTERGEKQDRFVIDPLKWQIAIAKVYPGDILTISGKADTGTSVIGVSVNWLEPL